MPYGDGQYSMYVVSTNGIIIYEGIDKRDITSVKHQPVSNDLMQCTLTMGAIDCNSKGQIVFDMKSQANNNVHYLKCF